MATNKSFPSSKVANSKTESSSPPPDPILRTQDLTIALGNVGGIYVITDIKTGKQYIGSAYGGIGLWQRWSAYAKNGHGGNQELRDLLSIEGADYARHFQFSLLEICDLYAHEKFVWKRESHWKKALRTREFGLNSN